MPTTHMYHMIWYSIQKEMYIYIHIYIYIMIPKWSKQSKTHACYVKFLWVHRQHLFQYPVALGFHWASAPLQWPPGCQWHRGESHAMPGDDSMATGEAYGRKHQNPWTLNDWKTAPKRNHCFFKGISTFHWDDTKLRCLILGWWDYNYNYAYEFIG